MPLIGNHIRVPIAIVAALSGTQNSTAAVRMCQAQTIGLASAPTEIEAKKKALVDWKAKAVLFGENYTNWSLSAERSLECKADGNGMFACVAQAMPCIVDNAPNTFEIRKKRRDI